MKHILAIALTCLLTISVSCTHNDGDIGPIFGQWKLISMQCEGTDIVGVKDLVYWSFQAQTIETKEVAEPHTIYRSYGNYRLQDGTLLISFPDAAFPPRPYGMLPREAAMKVLELSHSRMVLAHGDPDTIYTFHKW